MYVFRIFVFYFQKQLNLLVETGTLIIGLMQKDRRKRRKEGGEMHTIGYVLYQVKDEPDGPLDVTFFKRHASFARAPNFVNMREVAARHKLPPGKYCVVPSTFEPGEEADFLLRIYSEKPQLAEYVRLLEWSG